MLMFLTFIPIINFLFFAGFGRLINRKYLVAISTSGTILAIFLTIKLFEKTMQGNTQHINVGAWFTSGLLEIKWNFALDSITNVMLLVVLIVSFSVQLYSLDYMKEDPHLIRFLSYLSLFTFFMLILLTSDNFVSLFLGWEGVGLCSYLLINFWFSRIQANKAALKAMIVNRIADLFYTVALLVIFFTFQSLDFSIVFSLVEYCNTQTTIFGMKSVSALSSITFLLFLGAMGKSAQIGLHTWLPDAMEGPTPVSALIHAATMVTAGVFLLIRCATLFESSPTTLVLISLIGAGTAFMAATIGLFQNDLKKVIAYSTCSQLGYMVFVIGTSQYTLSFFHLTNHAFFKALLFLAAGAVIHAMSDEQDMRKYGRLVKLLPFTYAVFLVGSTALIGFPFLSGFYSKDMILELTKGSVTISSHFSYWIGLTTAFFTTFYSARLVYLIFFTKPNLLKQKTNKSADLNALTATSLGPLLLGSIFFGYIGKDTFVGAGTPFWNGLFPVTNILETQIESEFLPFYVKILPFFGSITASIIVMLVIPKIVRKIPNFFESLLVKKIHLFLTQKWGFDVVYNRFLNQFLLLQAYQYVFKLIDKGLLEISGPTGGGFIAWLLGKKLLRFQTGKVYEYAASLIFCLYAGVICL